MNKKNIILLITTFIFIIIVSIIFIFDMGGVEAEVKIYPNNYWSTENHPFFCQK